MGSDFLQLLNTAPANGSIWAAGYRTQSEMSS
jgi:hypothetical protein